MTQRPPIWPQSFAGIARRFRWAGPLLALTVAGAVALGTGVAVAEGYGPSTDPEVARYQGPTRYPALGAYRQAAESCDDGYLAPGEWASFGGAPGQPAASDSEPAESDAGLGGQPPRELTAGYDRGFYIQAAEPSEMPFRLKVNFQNQFRYTGFAAAEDSWTDSAGNVLPISDRNDFDIVRGRVIFSGHAIDPDLNYYLNLDYGTLGSDQVTVLLGSVSYRVSDGLELFCGKGKVPGSREWLLSSMYSHSPDRSLATTFFRPSITTGVWARGEPTETLLYHVMVGNGFNTASSGFRDLDTNFVYSGNLAWEPWGRFGPLYSDLEYRDQAAVRFGGSLTSSRQSGTASSTDAPEHIAIRLSDGTDINRVGALAPDVLISDYSLYLANYDVGWKYRGISLSGEYYWRWLTDITGSGPIPVANQGFFDHGFYAQAGKFVVPGRVELLARTSQIYGEIGDGAEYAIGFNCFPRQNENWRIGFDVTQVERSPAQQIRTGYEAGATGMMFRMQVQTMF